MSTERKNGRNEVQANHHRGLFTPEELHEYINNGQGIGYNDLSAHFSRRWVQNGVPPLAVGPLNNAVKYITTRLGSKDDTAIEIEKAIWYLMDAHNRVMDSEGKPRRYAPWSYTGKIEEQFSITPPIVDFPMPESGTLLPSVYDTGFVSDQVVPMPTTVSAVLDQGGTSFAAMGDVE